MRRTSSSPAISVFFCPHKISAQVKRCVFNSLIIDIHLYVLMKNSTLNALADFSEHEKELTNALFGNSNNTAKSESPSNNTINNILNYSAALSVRKSKHIENIFLVLN